MSKESNKQNLLKLLTLKNEWLGLSAILTLEPSFKERTLRRLLSELRDVDNKIEQQGKGRSTRYRAVLNLPSSLLPTTLHEDANIKNTIFSPKSMLIIQAIRKPIYERSPVSYNKVWFDSYIPNSTFYFNEQQLNTMAERGCRKSNEIVEVAGTYSKKILNRLLIDLSYNSSRLEGNTYSIIDTEKLLIEGVKQTDKLDEERVMLLNHKDAIEYLVRNAAKFEITMNELCTLHYLLSDGLLPAECMGKVRGDGVRIGLSTYSPLEGKSRLSSYLNDILLKASQIINPYEQSFFLLIHIAYLQPFMDVNKRTARLSANIPLIKQNMVPLSFNELNKEDYLSSMLAVYELNDVSAMVDLYYFSYLRTCQAYDATVESVGFDPIRVKYRQQRRNLVAKIIREKMIGTAKKNSIVDVCNHEVSNNEQSQFITSVEDDLRELTTNTIAGLGISQLEFKQWRKYLVEHINLHSDE